MLRCRLHQGFNGDCPVDDFLESLTPKCVQGIKCCRIAEANAPQRRESPTKFIGDGFLNRAKQSSNITRVLYFFTL